MAGPVLYSTNPWLSADLAEKYRHGIYFAWVCEYFDSEREAPAGSAGAMIAPNSNPRKIYEDLWNEYRAQEEHTRVIRDHKKTFRRLAKEWLAAKEISQEQYGEIIASLQAGSWKIWRPVVYVIPKAGIDPTRVIPVKRAERGGYGPEHKIVDLRRQEFDIIELPDLVRMR